MKDKFFTGYNPDFFSKIGAKAVPNYPGYYVTKDAKVYSTRNSSTGQAKLLKTRATGSVTLCRGLYDRKQISVEFLAKKVWGEDK